jgi:hypothetical protein
MQYSDILTIASVHATILSIIAAVGLISVSLINGKKLDVMDRAYSDLMTVQDLFSDGNPRLVPREPNYDTGVDSVRRRVLSELPQVSFGPAPICESDTKCGTADELGEKAFLDLISLAHHYPFSAQNEYRPDGIFQGKDSLLRGEKVEDYLQWYEDIKGAISHIVYIWETPGNSLLSNVEAYQTRLGEPKENPTNDLIEDYRKRIESIELDLSAVQRSDVIQRQKLVQHRNILRRQLEELEREGSARNKRDLAFDILTTFVKAHEKVHSFTSFPALKRYAQLRNPGFQDTLIISLIVTFFFGVFLPMIHPVLQVGNLHAYVLYVLVPAVGHVVSVICASYLNSY